MSRTLQERLDVACRNRGIVLEHERVGSKPIRLRVTLLAPCGEKAVVSSWSAAWAKYSTVPAFHKAPLAATVKPARY